MQYIIFKEFDSWKGTKAENYFAVVQNASEIHDFSDFGSVGEIVDYIRKYIPDYCEIVIKGE